MAVTLAAYEISATIGTTEWSIGNNSSTIAALTNTGVFQPFLDLNALAAGDTFQFSVYEKIATGGTQRLLYQALVSGVQAAAGWPGPSLILGVGWDMTLKKIAGTDRTIVARIAKT